jgi:hypothetical protein
LNRFMPLNHFGQALPVQGAILVVALLRPSGVCKTSTVERTAGSPAIVASYFAPVTTGRSSRAPHSDHEPS